MALCSGVENDVGAAITRETTSALATKHFISSSARAPSRYYAWAGKVTIAGMMLGPCKVQMRCMSWVTSRLLFRETVLLSHSYKCSPDRSTSGQVSA
ncbi:hypothetical protein MRB53_041481 [Persea americana]|nr:hypothetical protein MRB53_041481 [Persea americana]